MQEYRSRFKDAPWFKSYSIVVGGAGGIGSWASFLLARASHELLIFDFDIIEHDNMGGQLYNRQSIGLSKPAALKTIINDFSPQVPIHTFGKYEATSIASRIMFSCFDNMAARKVFFEQWLGNYRMTRDMRNTLQFQEDTHASQYDELRGPTVFIDGRLEAETGIIYCIRNEEEAKKWQEEWFPDDRVANAPCTFRATSHNAAIIAGLMVAHLNNIITNYVEGMDMRVTPWKTTYELPTMTFTSEEVPNVVDHAVHD